MKISIPLANKKMSVQPHLFCNLLKAISIPTNDRYLNSYPYLIKAIKSLKMDTDNLVLIANAVFGWMPTQLMLNLNTLDCSLKTIKQLQNGRCLCKDDINTLATTFQTIKGKSIVAASKVLHFIMSDKFPIIDSKIGKILNLPTNGAKAGEGYISYYEFCHEVIKEQNFKEYEKEFKSCLKCANYRYKISSIRSIELMLFLYAGV